MYWYTTNTYSTVSISGISVVLHQPTGHLPPLFWDICRPNFGTPAVQTSATQLGKSESMPWKN